MKLSLKRLFGRSMTGDSNLAETPSPPSPRSAARKTALVTLALVLAIIGALAGGDYFAMRPVTLKIAVGPAHSNVAPIAAALLTNSRRLTQPRFPHPSSLGVLKTRTRDRQHKKEVMNRQENQSEGPLSSDLRPESPSIPRSSRTSRLVRQARSRDQRCLLGASFDPMGGLTQPRRRAPRRGSRSCCYWRT